MIASEKRSAQFDIDTAAAVNTEVVRSKRREMLAPGLNDSIKDSLVPLGDQFRVIRPLASNPLVFLYVALDRSTANRGRALIAVKGLAGQDQDLTAIPLWPEARHHAGPLSGRPLPADPGRQPCPSAFRL